jgi:8-hydroxy-5-deazaflavin:NADPH oxidoreductase
MKIAVIGAGNVGSALANEWLRHKHDIVFGSRDPGSAESPIRSIAVDEAARFGDVVVIALPWQVAYDLLPSLNLADKIVIECTNPLRAAPAVNGGAASGAEALQARAPKAKLVKAFNTTGANNMQNPAYGEGRLAMFYCGDHADAKKATADLIREVGFDAYDLGPLSNARLMEAQAELWIWLASKGGLGREFGFRLIRRV